MPLSIYIKIFGGEALRICIISALWVIPVWGQD